MSNISIKNYSNIGQVFSQIAHQNPDHIALDFSETTRISYLELDKTSNQIACGLLKRNLSHGDTLAICTEKTPLSYATIIACLKLGITYFCLDPNSPSERLVKITTQCQPALIVSQNPIKALSHVAPLLNFEELLSTNSTIPADKLNQVGMQTPAYIMFTSGSTGFPKGALITQENIVNFRQWIIEQFGVTNNDKLTSVNPLYFDNSVFDFVASLLTGATLCPFDSETVKNQTLLVKQIEARQCTIWFSVPSLLIYLTTLRALETNSWPQMRSIIFGGEAYPKTELKKLYHIFGARTKLWNVYGPTECTCICSAYPIQQHDFDDLNKLAPLGTLANLFDYVIVDHANNTPITEPNNIGELYLAGPQLSPGYFNDQQRTDQAFCYETFVSNTPTRYYKTGDLVYKDEHHQLHFAGRKDNQIKHMGYRIELEEIEAALNSINQVTRAVALYYTQPTQHAGSIIAFVQASAPISHDAIYAHLTQFIPSYMIPEEILFVDEMPKNANSKIDRSSLITRYTQKKQGLHES